MLSAREVSQDDDPRGRPDVAERAPRLHARVRRGRLAGERGVDRGSSPSSRSGTSRPSGSPALEGNGQRVYYGEGAPGDAPFVVVDTGANELDYQGTATSDQAQVVRPTTGDGGIPIGGLFQRALFAWRFRDVNLLISGLIHGDSRIMIYRDITQRVPKAAPFLKFDGDPYARSSTAGSCGSGTRTRRTNQYPYSDSVDLADVASPATQESAPGLGGRRELHPQLGQGGRRRVRRLDARTTWPTRRIRSSRSGRTRSPRCSRRLDRRAAELRRTSGTRRTCSRSRRASTRTTT